VKPAYHYCDRPSDDDLFEIFLGAKGAEEAVVAAIVKFGGNQLMKISFDLKLGVSGTKPVLAQKIFFDLKKRYASVATHLRREDASGLVRVEAPDDGAGEAPSRPPQQLATVVEQAAVPLAGRLEPAQLGHRTNTVIPEPANTLERLRQGTEEHPIFPWVESGSKQQKHDVKVAFMVMRSDTTALESPGSSSQTHLPMAVEREELLTATLDMRCALYDASKMITSDGSKESTIYEVNLEEIEGPIVDISTIERARTRILDEDRAHEAHIRSEILLLPEAAAAARTGRRWTVKSAHRKHTKLLLVKGTDRSPQHHPPIVIFGNFERWIEDFEAKFRTSNDISQLLRSLVESG
jgi:hypothetical protein